MRQTLLFLFAYLSVTLLVEVAAWGSDGKDSLASRLRRFDTNRDGKLSAKEMPVRIRSEAFPKYDANNDGLLGQEELTNFLRGRARQEPRERSADKTMKVVRNLRYAPASSHPGTLGALDLYLPSKERDFPLLFFVHGGAFVKGDKASLASNAARFVEQGYGVIAVNYRLSPTVRFPAHVEDVAAAYAWVQRNIQKYGGDAGAVFIAGGSAGGYLVALLSLDARFLKKHQLETKTIRGTIAISGLMNTGPVPPERLKMIWGQDPKTVRDASPQQHVRKDAPPILFLYADADKEGRKQQNQRTAEMLKQAGHPDVTVKELANRTHDSLRSHLANQNDPGLKLMLNFMDRLLRP